MSSLVPQQMSHAMDFESALDRDNPRSLVNILPTSVSTAIKAIPHDLYEMDFAELKKKLEKDAKREGFSMEALEMLRTAWWIEYNRAQKTLTPFNLSNVYSGLTYAPNFNKTFVQNSFRLLFIITPPVDYQVQQHRIMNLSFEQEIKILQMDVKKIVYNKEGKPIGEEIDSKLLSVQQKIAESMRNRLMGMPINRTMQVNQNFNHGSNEQTQNNFGGRSLSELDEGELEQLIGQLEDEKGITKEENVIEASSSKQKS